MLSSFVKKQFIRKWWIVALILLMHISFTSQTKQEEKSGEIPHPSKEQFSPASGVVAPWRDSGCLQPSRLEGRPGCYLVKADEFRKATEMQIFNGDGSIWYAFSLDLDSPRYWWKDSRRLLVPFSTLHPKDYPDAVILLLVSESENWYEVEINNDTSEIKYIYKKDLLWKKTTWDQWLTDGFVLYLKKDHPSLLDAPNGKAIPKSSELRFERVQFVKRDGDWAYVRGLELTDGRVIHPEYGWLRWKKGKELLVGCIFNGNNLPK